jgi:putative membrane protein
MSETSTPAITTELAARRTGMAFQRTRLSADRTLMAVMRTSLSLISFGFTIYQFFDRLEAAHFMTPGGGARRFGIVLAGIGIAMLILGMYYHVAFMLGLRKQRADMVRERLIHGQSGFPPSLTLITASVLLIVGLIAILSMIFNVPFL